MTTNVTQQENSNNEQAHYNDKTIQELKNSVEKREFELGVAPDDAYVKTTEQYLPGDVVVLKTLDLLNVTDLITLERYQDGYWQTNHPTGRIAQSAIRPATTHELKAKQRLEQKGDCFKQHVINSDEAKHLNRALDAQGWLT